MIRAFALVLLFAGPVFAQDSTMGFEADPTLIGHEKKKTNRDIITRMGLAVSLAFDATTWANVGVSSEPAHAATRLIKSGNYRLELLQLVLIARESKGQLLDLTTERAKGKKTLRQMANAAGVDYEAIYRESEKLSANVDRRLQETLRVRSDRATGKRKK